MIAVSNHRMSEVSEFIKESIGLYFPPAKYGELKNKLNELSKEYGYKDVDSFIEILLGDRENKVILEQLTLMLTIGETYFWRDRELFRVLETEILPKIIESKQNSSKSIRIWSAGCSSGEEPYSIAILLKRLIPDINHWKIIIKASDINPSFLKKAIEGTYSEWSFRSAPHWLKDGYFKKVDKNQYQLDKTIRQMVQFSYLNFFRDDFPSAANDTNSMDVIFCRNVFIYFAIEDIINVSDKLYNCLVKDGILITTPSESFQYLSTRFRYAFHKNVAVYHRNDHENQPGSKLPEVNMPDEEIISSRIRSASKIKLEKLDRIGKKESIQTKKKDVKELSFSDALSEYYTGNYKKAIEILDQIKTESKDSMMLRVRIIANEGKLNEALVMSQQLVDKHKLYADAYLLKATIESELSNPEAAIKSLQNALFLDPELIIAHFTLGNISTSFGNEKQANKHFRNAMDLLGKMQTEEIVPESDGITAERLKQIIRTYLTTS
jgi:chemotaxis protein methyltransferase CheR